MALVQVQNLTKYFGTRELFRDISFEVFEQDHIGLIGVNGCGKTTLLSLLLRQQEADAGTVSIARDCRIAALEQALPDRLEDSLLDVTLSVFDELMAMERELESIAAQLEAGEGDTERLVQRQYRLREAFEQGGGMTYRSRARSALWALALQRKILTGRCAI